MAPNRKPTPRPQPHPAAQDETQTLPALTGDGFIDHIMVEHSQFLTLLENTRSRLGTFLEGETTLGAIQRLYDDINKALPATMPTGAMRRLRDEINKALPATMPTQLVGGGK